MLQLTRVRRGRSHSLYAFSRFFFDKISLPTLLLSLPASHSIALSCQKNNHKNKRDEMTKPHCLLICNILNSQISSIYLEGNEIKQSTFST